MWYNAEPWILDLEQQVTVSMTFALCAVVLGSIGAWRLGCSGFRLLLRCLGRL